MELCYAYFHVSIALEDMLFKVYLPRTEVPIQSPTILSALAPLVFLIRMQTALSLLMASGTRIQPYWKTLSFVKLCNSLCAATKEHTICAMNSLIYAKNASQNARMLGGYY